MNEKKSVKRRSLFILLVFILLVFFLCLWLYTRNAPRGGERNAVQTARKEVTFVFLPSGDADETALALMTDAAAQFCEDILASYGDAKLTALYWKDGAPPEGPSCGTADVSGPDALKNALAQARTGGNLTTALQYAKDTGADLDRTVILLTDRVPGDGARSEEGPYDKEDSALYAYANAGYQAAAELSIRDSLATVAFLQGLSGQDLTFTRRFLNDIQTDGYFEVTNAGTLDALRKQLASDLLSDSGAQKLTFRYPHGHDYTAVCYYTDDYFSASPYEYNPSLATMSMSFSMAAFASGDQNRYANKSANARKLLQDIGVSASAIETNQWFTVRPETDSIAAVAGNKPITVNGETFTLIAVAIRGGGYGREWASNFTIGESGQHSGFDTAKNNVLAFLTDYIRNQKISGPVKFWVTGYSRAAAAANLVGGALDQGYDFGADISYTPNDVYAYCLGTPAGALISETRNQELYYNIFNIINQSDPVPYVAPSPMGFARYGVDRYLPSAQSSSNYLAERAAMLRVFNALESTDKYVVDDFQMKRLNLANLLSKGKSVVEDDAKNNYSQGLYLSNFITLLTREDLKDREHYVANYESEIREVCSVIFGCSDAQQKTLVDSLKRQASESWGDVAIAYLNPTVSKEDAFSIISDWLVTAVNEAGVTDYDEETVRSAGVALSDLVLNLLMRHPNYAATMAMNLGGIGDAHSWELCYAWLASMDDNYKRGAEVSFNNGDYRVVRVNCDVDVSVRNESGELVAEIHNEDPRDIRGSSIISTVNDNGEKIVILPMDSAYQVSVTRRESDSPTESGAAPTKSGVNVGNSSPEQNVNTPEPGATVDAPTGQANAPTEEGAAEEGVNVSIDEYSAAEQDFTRGVDYLGVELAEGATLNASIPARKDGETAYTLTAPDGNDIPSTSDLSGAAASDAVYIVTVSASDELGGMTFGGGAFRYGDFAQIEAVPQSGYAFSGWYSDTRLLSTDAVYRFCVTEDRTLTARFTSVSVNPFSDVSERSYCYDAVLWAVGAGIASGTTDTTFSPKEVCTAAQAVTFLWRAAGSPEPASTQSPFTDLDPDAYYYKAVLWAAEHDITMGTTETTFSPDKTVSRSQFITLLYRTFGDAQTSASHPFRDVSDDAYYRDAVAWAYTQGVTRGTTPETFEPVRSCDRGQIVTFLYRFFVR